MMSDKICEHHRGSGEALFRSKGDITSFYYNSELKLKHEYVNVYFKCFLGSLQNFQRGSHFYSLIAA